MTSTHPDSRLVVIVDGSNVASSRTWYDQAGIEPSQRDRSRMSLVRDRLVDACLSWAAQEECALYVVFDGVGPSAAARGDAGPRVTIAASGEESGDAVVARRALEAVRSGERYWLVTSDHDLKLRAGGGAERLISAHDFAVLVGQASSRPNQRPATANPQPSGQRLADAVNEDVRARLEQLRRGHE